MPDLEEIKSAALQVLADEPVVFALLFGSQARGDARVDSDVDVALFIDESASESEHVDIQLRAMENFSKALHCKTDVVILNAAYLRLKGRAVQEGIPIYERDEVARVRYVVKTRIEYLDFKPSADRMDREVLKRMAEGSR